MYKRLSKLTTSGETVILPNCRQALPEILHYPSGNTANGFLGNMCGVLNMTLLIAVEAPSAQKEQMLTNPKNQRARLHVPYLIVLSSDSLSR